MDGQLSQRQIPVLNRMCSTLGGLEYASVKQLQQAVFIGEATLGLGRFAQFVNETMLYRAFGGNTSIADVQLSINDSNTSD